MRIIFLGTNGWYNTNIANTACIFLETEDCYIIFDAGDGFYKIDKFIKENKPIYLFLSHFHLDHITGLHTLNKFNFSQGIKIYGPPGMEKAIGEIICSPYSVDLNRLSYHVDLVEIEEGRHNLPFFLECRLLTHSVSTFGYRIKIEDCIVSYCSDTGVCENAIELSRSVDLVMCECSLKSGQSNEDWPHLNPQTAARIAKDASAKRLALIHFNPYFYPSLNERVLAEEEAKKIFANTFQAKDDMEIQIGH
ncbi:MAG: MBL fold metallo-hydrolase [Candidatus Omnitrophica bacterium]|nr:MBL fold metallo-hydrolase [Candidatus Omnitrophota bacterium]